MGLAHAHPTPLTQINAWHDDLAALRERIAPRFDRPDVRDRVGRSLAGLLGPVERRNGWQLAEQIGERTPDDVQRRVARVVADLPDDAWQRLTVGAGSKGPRVFDWTLAHLPHDTKPGFDQCLLVRHAVPEPEEEAYYRVFGPAATTLAEMARVAGTRWVIEEGFARAKGEVGLDQYEVRRWDGWRRHITLSLLAHAYLEVTRAVANGTAAKRGRR